MRVNADRGAETRILLRERTARSDAARSYPTTTNRLTPAASARASTPAKSFPRSRLFK
jgi:hypothetical protein